LGDLLTKQWLSILLVLGALITPMGDLLAQDTTLIFHPDSTAVVADTMLIDSLSTPSSSMGIEARVDYKATDSLIFSIKDQKAFLYNNADLNYQEINLKAAYVDIDFSTSLLYATFVLDSLSKEQGRPVFTNAIVADTVLIDSLSTPSSSMGIDARVDYKATDSLIFSIKDQKAFLYNNADLNYQEINL
jgi:hypothetical protein